MVERLTLEQLEEKFRNTDIPDRELAPLHHRRAGPVAPNVARAPPQS
jgi:hypothetical protein